MLDLTSDYGATLGIMAALLVILLWYYYNRKLTKPYSGFPTFPAVFYFVQPYLKGKFPKKIPITASFLYFQHAIIQLFKREELILFWWGFQPYVFLTSIDAVKFFITHPAAAEKSKIYEVLKTVVGNGLITSNSKIWAQHRKIMNPTFHRQVYKNYVPVFNRKARELVQNLKKETGKPWIDIEHVIKYCAFYILCETVLGVKEDSVAHGSSVEKYFEAVAKILDFTVHRIIRPWLNYDILLPLFPDGRKYLHMCDSVHSFGKQIIKEMMEASQEPSERYAEEENFNYVANKCKPFVRSFVEEHRKNPEAFTLEDVENELTTIMIAGYDTSTMSLTSALYLLGLDPEIQERAYNEIERLAGSDLSYEDTLELPYLESIIKETLRIYPASPIIARHLSKEVQYGKYTVPKDANIVFFPYIYHRNPETFPNPEKFDPDRFAPDKKDRYGRFSYMPFGEGPRYCIGKSFAMIEIKVILAHIIRNFKIVSLDPRDKVNYKWNIVLTPINPTRIRLISRDRVHYAR